MTALELLTEAMLELTVLQAGESPSDAEAQDALRRLNNMLHGWDLESIRLNHTDLTLTDTVPYPANHRNPIIYNLAIELNTQYGRQITPDLASKAENGYRALQNYYADPRDAKTDPALNPYYNPNSYYAQ